jgi:amino acid adenylation domain-containing protein
MRAWNQTAAPRPANACVHHLFEEHARRNPEHVAIDAGGESMSYRELNRRTNQLASLLRRKGVGPDDRVAVVMNRSPEAIVSVLSVVKAGAAFLPLGPDLPQDRLTWMLENAEARLAICREPDLPKIGAPSCEPLSFDRIATDASREPAENLPDAAASSSAAYVIYTSGSTGKPKAIVVTHESLVNYVLAAAKVFDLSERDRRLQFASPNGDLFVADIFNYLSCGATLVSCATPPGNSVHEFIRLLETHRITITGLPASWWNEWVAGMAENDVAVPSSLRAVIVGMERVHAATLATWKDVVGSRVRWFNAYGPAEATCTATVYEGGSSEWEGGEIVPIGKPLSNVTAYVLDAGGSPLPAGIPGELYLGGAGVARGYLNAPDLTAERFVADRLGDNPGGRLYRTGDLAFFLPDGNLVFAGRSDRQVKIRGFRIELDEIEAALADHPSVRQCAVVVHEQQGGQTLIAYLAANGAAAPTDTELRRHLARRLPDYMMPAAFVMLERLPSTSNGKVDRHSLPAYVPAPRESERAFFAPSTPTEIRLCALWREVLGMERVGLTDNFFECGGDSLRATRLITLIQRDLRQEIPFALLLRAPTVALLATALDAGDTSGPFPPALVPIQPLGSRPPFYCVHGSGPLRHLARYLGLDQPFLGIPSVEPSAATTQDSIEETASRHVALLRTVQPHGPYLLGGCCYAGVIAYEMARQLHEAGESVPLLVLFDAVNPAVWGFRSWRTIGATLWYHARTLRSLPIRDAWGYVAGRLASVGNLVRDRIRRAWPWANRAFDAPRPHGVAYIEGIGFDKYRPRPYLGPTVLFCGQWTRPYVDSKYGWGTLIGDGLDVIRLPGGHLEMLEEPVVATLAQQLDSRLREASRSASGAEAAAC